MLEPNLSIADVFSFNLCNQLGRNCHQSDATTTSYRTTRAVIKRRPGAAHDPSAQNSRNNPSIRWASDAVFHYTTPRTVRSSLTKQWARKTSRQNANLALGFIHGHDKWSWRHDPHRKKNKTVTVKKGKEKDCYCTGCLRSPNTQRKLHIYSLPQETILTLKAPEVNS